jgi:hypothetical protein
MPPWRYPVKAFCPHGALMGFDIGANADAERYSLAFDARYVHNAPWPPMLWPNIDIRLRSYTSSSAWVGRNKCQSSQWVGRQFLTLAGSQIGCVCACCNVGHTLDLWHLGRNQPLKRSACFMGCERIVNLEPYLCQSPSHRLRLRCLHHVEKYQ